MRVLSVLFAAVLAVASAALAPLDLLTTKAVAMDAPLDIFVQFPVRPRAPAARLAGLSYYARLDLIHRELVAHADRFQGHLVATLQAEGVDARMRWINNALYIRNASSALVQRLAALPHVVEITADQIIATIDAPVVRSAGEDAHLHAPVWNIELIGAPLVWANTTRGEGIVVAGIDTGVRSTHVALVGSYRGTADRSDDYNWYDPREQQATPYDPNGHGTHTAGSMVGIEVGVAPGATWIAAKGCATLSCSTADLSGSFQYLLAPTPQGQYDNPAAGDTRKAPRVINNSWGGGSGSSQFLPFIQPHLEAGTVVVFSQGNSGSACATVNSPGDLAAVIGVGSTDINDALSTFSSRGPGLGTSLFPSLKPDIVAPGEAIYSTLPDSDTAYGTYSGTSMAGPHVAGLAALVLSVNPSIDHQRFEEIIKATSVQGLPSPKGGLATCSGVDYTQYPNFHYGFGRISAVAAVDLAKKTF